MFKNQNYVSPVVHSSIPVQWSSPVIRHYHPPRKQNESVLGKQSICGKIVSLILCVGEPGYVKSGHI